MTDAVYALSLAEADAICARMRAEVAETLAILRAADSAQARIFYWSTRIHYVGLVVPGTCSGTIGDPYHNHGHPDANARAILDELDRDALDRDTGKIPRIVYVGAGHVLASNLGSNVGILVHPRGLNAGFTADPPLGGMPVVDLFDRLGLGVHWRWASRLYADEQVRSIQNEARKIAHEARERAVKASLMLAVMKANLNALEDQGEWPEIPGSEIDAARGGP